MALQDTSGLIIETDVAAASLPDPTTVNGRTHLLVNTGLATCIWSSTGITPFQEVSINVATISVLRGQFKIVQSDGVHWLVKPISTAGRHTYAATGVSDAAGLVTFTFPTPFLALPKIALSFEGAASPSPVDYRIVAISTTAVTVAVRQSLATVIALLGLTLIAASLPLAGATIHLIATDAGETF